MKLRTEWEISLERGDFSLHLFSNSGNYAPIWKVGETGAQWIRNLLFQYITDPLRAIAIFQSTNDNTLDGVSNSST